MTREFNVNLGYDYLVRNWPQDTRELRIRKYCDIIESIIIKNHNLECKQYLQQYVEFRNKQEDIILELKNNVWFQETTSFIQQYIDQIEVNVEPCCSNEAWWYFIDSYFLLEVIDLDVFFCSPHFIYHLNRYYYYPNDYSDITITDFYSNICNSFLTHHNNQNYSTLLKSWLLLFRIIEKQRIDTLTRNESKEIFEKLFETLINDITELNYTATYYHYLVHYWKEVYNMSLDYLALNDDEMLNRKSIILRKNLDYLTLINKATQKYSEVVRFNYDDIGYGEFDMKLILQDTATSVNQPIFKDYNVDRYRWDMKVGWSMGDLNYEEKKLYDEFLNNKSTDDYIQFLHTLKNDLRFSEVIERRISEINLLSMLKSNYRFDGFLHFTDFRNLTSIMMLGKILSRNSASDFLQIDAAEISVINRTDEIIKKHVRFYYKEKTPTLYSNEGIKQNAERPHMPIPTMLTFSETLIYRLDKLFLDGGGGSTYTHMTKSAKEALDFRWDQIFYRGPVPNGNNTLISVFGETKGHILTNKKNAEFLCLDEVSLDYLEKITFRTPADLKMYKMQEIKSKNVKLEVEPSKFNIKDICELLYDFYIKFERNDLYLGFIFVRYNENFKYSLLLFNNSECEMIFDLKNDESHDGIFKLDIPHYLKNYDFYCKIEEKLLQEIDRVELNIDDICTMSWRKRND